jgi:hypothetical protein
LSSISSDSAFLCQCESRTKASKSKRQQIQSVALLMMSKM